VNWVLLTLAMGGGPDGGPNPRRSPGVEVVFLAEARPVRVRVECRADRRPLPDRWADHVTTLFAYFDRNGDGFLSAAELEHVIPVEGVRQLFRGEPYHRGTDGPPEMKAIDTDKDGKLSAAELAAYYRPILADLVRAKEVVSPPADQAPTEALFALFDTDGNGVLSRAELAEADRVRGRLDGDDDECVSLAELLGTAGGWPTEPHKAVPATALAERVVRVFEDGLPTPAAGQVFVLYDKNKDGKLTRAEVGFDRPLFDRLDADKDGVLTQAELDAWRTGPPDAVVTLTLGDDPSRNRASVGPTPANVLARQGQASSLVLRVGTQTVEFGTDPTPPSVRDQHFRTFLQDTFPPDKKEVTDAELSGPENQFLRVIFDAADRDGNGTLTRAEFDRYFALQRQTGELGLTLSHTVRTPGLFQLLDENGDLKLGPRELRTAWQRLSVLMPPGADGVTREVLRPSVSVRLGRVVVAGGPGVAPIVAPAAGPVWFRKMDRNGDGDVSRREFLGPAATFAAIDADGDGLISLAEAEAFDKKVRK
jgi:Ca2+-binding EF-hand superfamily protein